MTTKLDDKQQKNERASETNQRSKETKRSESVESER